MDRLGLVIAAILTLFLTRLDSGKANTLTSCSNVYSELSLLQFRYYTEIPLSPVNCKYFVNFLSLLLPLFYTNVFSLGSRTWGSFETCIGACEHIDPKDPGFQNTRLRKARFSFQGSLLNYTLKAGN